MVARKWTPATGTHLSGSRELTKIGVVREGDAGDVADRSSAAFSVEGAFAAWIAQENGGDLVVDDVSLVGDADTGADFSLLELEDSLVSRCSYASCDFTCATFTNVTFAGCDFSNCDFSEANFTGCTFSSCKFTGTNFLEATFVRVEVRDSTCAYASFARARLEDFAACACDFSHADITEVRQRRISFDDVRFSATNFFRTNLANIDFTTCQLDGIMLSDIMSELRGCRMDMYQAASIAQILGVEIAE